MKNASYREWEFEFMGKYFHEGTRLSIDEYYRSSGGLGWSERVEGQYNGDPDFIIVYLEDFLCENPNQKGDDESGKEYRLLLDFFTISDYIRFQERIGNKISHDKERNEDYILRSTFFTIDNYKTKDKPIKGAHYYLNLYEMEGVQLNPDKEIAGGFPLLYSFLLQSNEEKGRTTNDRLLYLTQPLIYPQYVFSRFHHLEAPLTITKVEKADLLVWNVGQGNFNEIRIGGKDGIPYVLYDAGSDVLREKKQFSERKSMLTDRLMKEKLPLFVLSHWHTDHYSLLFAQSDDMLRSIQNYAMPAYVKNLSVFLLIARLYMLGISHIDMVKLPFSSRWEGEKINENLMLFANRYEHNKVNDSGLTLFVKGPHGNAMLPGDCKYTIAEGETNEAIEKMGAKNRNLCLVIPHHGGNAGKCVTYNVSKAKAIEGIVSVGEKNGYGHPKEEVMEKIKGFVPKVRMTMKKEDLNGGDHIFVEL